jgi:hypothetical protein
MDDVGASEHDDMKERLVIEGLQDWIHLSENTRPLHSKITPNAQSLRHKL